MSSRHAAPAKSRGIISSRFLAALAAATPLFATPTHSPCQYHSKDLSFPLFSYSYALFCIARSRILCIFNFLYTLGPKHPGGRRVSALPRKLALALTRLLPATYTHASSLSRHCVPDTL